MMEMVSSPARKLEAAMARFVLRGVFPKKEIAGGLDDPPVAETDAMVLFRVLCCVGWVYLKIKIRQVLNVLMCTHHLCYYLSLSLSLEISYVGVCK